MLRLWVQRLQTVVGAANITLSFCMILWRKVICFVCAAGNDGADVEKLPTYPAAYDLDNIISVGAVNSQGKLASFSNYGNGVDVAAPGEDI